MSGDMTLEQQLDLALSHHQAGQLAEAEAIYRQVLSVDPNDADVLHLLGVVANQAGRHDEAIDLIGRAIALDPDYAEAHFNLGHAFADQGRYDQAIASYQKAIQLTGDYVEAHFNLGDALLKTSRFDEAIASFQRAVQLKPDYAKAYNSLGSALAEKGRHDEAIAAYRRAIELKPDFAEAHNNIGEPLKELGRFDDAVAAYRRAIQVKPDFAEAYGNLGNVLSYLGRFDDAVGSYRKAISLKPDLAATHSNLGNALKDKGQLDDAIVAYGQAIRLKPDYAEAYSNLGAAMAAKGQLDDAIVAYRQAVRLKPDYAEAYSNLGKASKDMGQLDDAIAFYHQAMRLKPDLAEAHSNLLYALHFHPGFDAGMIHEESRRWNRQHAEPLEKFIHPHANSRDPDRRLRIGYVSPDFREHVVGQTLLPLLREHDHRQVEIFCYANMVRSDAFTEQIRGCADVWRSIVGLSDSQAADLIRQDRIDILVDLTLHLANNRLFLFARKPAPVQVTYLGYCSSTGMNAMDYRFSDPHMDPPNSDLSCYSERTIRLPETYWCYNARGPTPEPSPSPASAMGYVTFGCLNNFAKVSAALELWAQMLQRVPRSRLIVHSHPGSHLDAVRERFAGKGISPDRLEFPNWQPWPEYVQTYGRIDIALDPFPWSGGITTCDALWLGVPVVSLAGRTAVGRGGASILANVGVPELIARTPQQYVQIATELANDLPRLGELRRTLRGRMQASPLTDAPRFARNVEAAYRQMWRNWCQEGAKSQGA
jgi:predicted O-linked N-acetylglucosamine transferase (SPINDLY family)